MHYKLEEFLIVLIAKILNAKEIQHIAVGAASPIPGAGALLRRELSKTDKLKVSIIHGNANNPLTDGGRELFDLAGQGRIDAFFLGGGQIDGRANINLVGIGEYPRSKARFPGSFGSAYLYFLVPRVILFREEHTPRVLVPKVDFISAPGISAENIYRPGGPYALVTGRCVFIFNKKLGSFFLKSLHPGHTIEEVDEMTGFTYEKPINIPQTPKPSAATIELIRGLVADEVSETYPAFAERVFAN